MLDEDTAQATPADLAQAADRLRLVLVGQPVRSYFSLASKARRDGTDHWLRVRRGHLLTWTPRRLGYQESAAVHGVPKPVVTEHTQWFDAPDVIHAELLTYIAEPTVSPTIHLKTRPELPERWWTDLHSAVDNLADTPTTRDGVKILSDRPYLRRFYGTDLPDPTEWATEHEDPHWANLTGPQLHILDWDFWGRQPRGYTAAGLYCTSLAIPEISDRIWKEFADILDTPTGRWCVLYHLWYRRKGLPTFTAWHRAVAKAQEILTRHDH